MSIKMYFLLIAMAIFSLALATTAESIYATYTAPLTNANQIYLSNALNTATGICGSDSAIVGQVNTNLATGAGEIMFFIKTATDQTLEAWKATSCGASLTTSFATQYTPPATKTDLDIQTECIVGGVGVCGTTTESLCPCSTAQTAIYIVDMSKQAQLGAIRSSTGICSGVTSIVSPLNTQEGIMVVLNTKAGETVWNFEQTNCGKGLQTLVQSTQTNMSIVQPILDECFEHGDHGHCGTTATSLCKCTVPQEIIYMIPLAKADAFTAIRAEGATCGPKPSRTQIFATLNTANGIQLYIKTTAGRTQWDFEQTACGKEIVANYQTSQQTGETAHHTIEKCWEHGDHGHCGPAECPCIPPASLVVTPIVFSLNMTHAETEGLLFFNNYFIKQLRSNADCKFSRYLATYADQWGYEVRVYFDQLPSACNSAKIEELRVTAFRLYWVDAVARYNHDHPEETEDPSDPHAGHDHFIVTADDHDHAHGPIVANVVGVVIGEAMTLDVTKCWNPTTNGLFCAAQSECPQILCPIGTHCHTNAECGTGICSEHADEDDHDHDDHSGHNHNEIKDDSSIVQFNKVTRNDVYGQFYFNEEFGLNIEPVDREIALSVILADHHEGDDHDHPDLICQLAVSAGNHIQYGFVVAISMIVAVIFMV